MPETSGDPTYPNPYYYLWHLAALRVLDADYGSAPQAIPGDDQSAVRAATKPRISSTAWDLIGANPVLPSRIALIDVGIAGDHPNLVTRVLKDRSIDLASHRFGARTVTGFDESDPYTPEQPHAFFEGLDLDALGDLGLTASEQGYFEEIAAELAGSKGCLRRLIDPEAIFAAHGTACAGLIAGEPAAIHAGTEEAATPETLFTASGPEAAPSKNRNVLPYFGVDPFSRLISIRTSFEPDPLQFIAAFLFAFHQGADVIVLPRGLPDPQRAVMPVKSELKSAPDLYRNRATLDLLGRLETASPGGTELNPKSPQDEASSQPLWTILKHIILAVSRKIPVVCAAGNSGESQLIYPASLAADGNGIIAVGAVTVEGFRSGYSNYGAGLTVVAPSDDDQVINRHQLRIDRLSPLHAHHSYTAGGSREIRYSHFSLFTTDIPGTWGYDGGVEPWSLVPFKDNPDVGGGYYTTFGGTSGASALIGGVCSLIQRAHKARHGEGARLGGAAVKTLLVGASSLHRTVMPGFRPLTPDCMNRDQEEAQGAAYFFGAGLPDAIRAVQSALAQ